MQRDRTNLYVVYRKTNPHHLNNNRTKIKRNSQRSKQQDEEGLLDLEEGIELDEFEEGSYEDNYTSIIQNIENQGNDLTRRIKENMRQLSLRYKEVLLPQFDDEFVRSEMNSINALSNSITDELRMIYKVINDLQQLDAVLISKEINEESKTFSDDSSSNTKGTRMLISNLKKKFAIVSQELSGEFREMQGKYIRYLKKDETHASDSNDFKEDIESYSRNAMVESGKQIETQIQLQKSDMLDDQQFLLDREREIYKISQSVIEISIIFKELENIVIDQGTILDNIEYNIDRTVENVQGAHKQLIKAEGYQKQTRKCKIIFFLVLLIIASLMLLMVKPRKVTHYVHDTPSNAESDGKKDFQVADAEEAPAEAETEIETKSETKVIDVDVAIVDAEAGLLI